MILFTPLCDLPEHMEQIAARSSRRWAEVPAASRAVSQRVPDRLGLQGGEHALKARLGGPVGDGEADHALEVARRGHREVVGERARGAPARSIAFTSWWAASQGEISATSPVSTFTTPAGNSAAASASAKATAGSG